MSEPNDTAFGEVELMGDDEPQPEVKEPQPNTYTINVSLSLREQPNAPFTSANVSLSYVDGALQSLHISGYNSLGSVDRTLPLNILRWGTMIAQMSNGQQHIGIENSQQFNNLRGPGQVMGMGQGSALQTLGQQRTFGPTAGF